MLVKRIIAAVFLVAGMLMVACQDFPNPIEPGTNGHVMVTHASPDAPNVDVFLDDNIFAKDLQYPNTTRYTSLKEGVHSLTLNQAGTNTVVLQADLDIMADKYYSVFACDAVANLTGLVLMDDFGTPEVTEAAVRFLHLSPDAPAVDLTTSDGTILFENVTFKQATEFKPLALGSYDLQVRLAGTEDVVLELNGVKFLPSAAYTIWVKGFVNGTPGQELGAEVVFHKFLK